MPSFLHDSVSSPAVLVVDDNAEMVEFLHLYLSRHGMRVFLAYSGQQCIEIAHQQPLDIIVLDVMMPGLSGLETCAALKASPHTAAIPVLLLTAKDDNDTRLKGIRLGICEFLTKPIRGKELLTRIRTQFAMRQWEHQLDEISGTVLLDEVQM